MKRSTTPIQKEKTFISNKPSHGLKLSTSKVYSKQAKKIICNRTSSNSGFIKKNIQQKSIQNSPQSQMKKKISQFELFSKINPENSESKLKSKKQQSNLTSYLITKSWQNSTFILSSQVKLEMKRIVVEWLIELSHYMKLKTETLYHSLWIFERCVQKISDLNAKNLQLLAITCLFISAKYEEIYPPHILALIQKTLNSFHKKQVIDLQQKILLNLNFELTAPNRYTFVSLALNKNKFLQQYDGQKFTKNEKNFTNQKRYKDFVNFLLEMTLLKSWNQMYSEKQIADAVIYAADKVMKRSQSLDQEDWLYFTKIQEIAYEIINFWKDNKNCIVSYIYDCDKYSFVGGLTILF